MSSADEESVRAGKLIERLLVDPQFRAEFRRDPAEACLAAGLPDLAAELGGSGKSMHTLELRESRSSLAGAVMAVAVEGIGIAEAQALVQHGLPGNVHGVARKLLHGHRLPNPLQKARRLASPAGLQHELHQATGAKVPHGGTAAATGGAAGAAGAGGAAGTAAGAGGPAAGAGGAAAGAGGAAAGAGAPGAGSGGVPVAGAGAGAAGAGAVGATAADAGSGVGSATGQDSAGGAASGGAASGGAASGGAGGSAGAPAGSSLPWPDEAAAGGGAASPASGGGVAPVGSSGAAQLLPQTPGAGSAGAGASAAPASGGAVPAPPVPGAQPAQGGVVPVWPDQQAGGGGAAVGVSGGAGGAGGGLAELLNSPRLSAPANVRAFLATGGVDPRMVSVLDSALANHSIGLGNLEALSDPVHVQAVDVVSVDGQPVGPANFGARDLVTEIAALDPSVRPSEIGTPWPIRSQGFFSDAGSVNRLHLAFEMPGTDSPAGGAAYPAGGAAYPAAPASGGAAYAAPGVAGGTPGLAGAPAVPGQAPVAGAVPGQAPVAGAVPGQAPGAVQGLAAAVGSPAVPTPSSPGRGPEALLAYAHSMIGRLPESAGENLGPALDKFEADFGFHGAAWCGIFVGHALEAAGLNPPHSVASVASILQLAQNGDPPFQKGVLPLSAARPGDLVTFGGSEHVAIVTSVDGQGVHTVGGNTGPGLGNVAEVTWSPGSVTGVVRPDYASAGPLAGGAGASITAPPPAAPIPGAGSGIPSTASPAGAAAAAAAAPGAPGVPGAVGAAPGTPVPGTAEFKALEKQEAAFHRHTVQFLQAVVPQPGSPLAAQVPGAQVPGAPAVGGQVPGVQPIPGVAGAPGAPVAPGTPGFVADQPGGQGPGVLPAGGGPISVSSSMLTSGQAKFAGKLAELTGLSPRVVAAWELAEESGGAAQGREQASNFNWLNIGYFDSGAGKIAFDHAFSDPVSAAEQTAKFLKGEWGGASPSIRAILNTVGQSSDQQISAIANSDWANGGGANLHGTYDELSDIHIQGTNVA